MLRSGIWTGLRSAVDWEWTRDPLTPNLAPAWLQAGPLGSLTADRAALQQELLFLYLGC